MKSPDPRNKFIFLLQLKRRSEKETSPYARLLFQENIISSLLIATLFTIELFLNKQTTKYVPTKERRINMEHIIKIKFESKIIETKTLGQLCFIINPFLEGNTHLKSSLKSFIDMRNNITHKMFSKYENMEELENDSRKVIKIGEKVIKELDIFRNKIFEEWNPK
ncbi:MAG: hypothetical protein UW76_C0021G0002 [Parcubacteria group bacterium GW2011_GWF2_44_8b]|nr:MAG: hypothetical protein UW76_C0021G0002 [Parcubacteria group bacterium GW2011_GWF2_44_8b]KKT85753.1 MAG: hypothetical protein UW83_C0009G0008 [Parcubacteria group bacterium GW2011_GWD1_44_9]